MKIKNINCQRESLTLPINGKDETWDYLTIYDEKGNILKQSGHHHPEGTIRLEYNELIFVAPSISKDRGEEYIYITVKSLKDYVNKGTN